MMMLVCAAVAINRPTSSSFIIGNDNESALDLSIKVSILPRDGSPTTRSLRGLHGSLREKSDVAAGREVRIRQRVEVGEKKSWHDREGDGQRGGDNRSVNQPDRDQQPIYLEAGSGQENRGAMLKRKTPIRAKSGFKKRGGRLRAVSKSRAKVNEIYRAAKQMYMFEHPNCEICGKVAHDLHHKCGRGKNLCNMNTFMALCRLCHDSVHHNVAWARERGYIQYDYKP